jgi:hypothetical protein
VPFQLFAAVRRPVPCPPRPGTCCGPNGRDGPRRSHALRRTAGLRFRWGFTVRNLCKSGSAARQPTDRMSNCRVSSFHPAGRDQPALSWRTRSPLLATWLSHASCLANGKNARGGRPLGRCRLRKHRIQCIARVRRKSSGRTIGGGEPGLYQYREDWATGITGG